jgi:TonB family protein
MDRSQTSQAITRKRFALRRFLLTFRNSHDPDDEASGLRRTAGIRGQLLSFVTVCVRVVLPFMAGAATRSIVLLLAATLATGCATVPPTPPLPVSSHAVTAADYPRESIPLHEEGTTQVQFLVLVDGTVGDTIIARPSGSPRLDQAAIRIVTGWRYKPATENGRPVPAWLYSNVVFVLR